MARPSCRLSCTCPAGLASCCPSSKVALALQSPFSFAPCKDSTLKEGWSGARRVSAGLGAGGLPQGWVLSCYQSRGCVVGALDSGGALRILSRWVLTPPVGFCPCTSCTCTHAYTQFFVHGRKHATPTYYQSQGGEGWDIDAGCFPGSCDGMVLTHSLVANMLWLQARCIGQQGP